MLSSLSNRIFLASALLAVLSIGTALFLVNVVVTRQAEAELEESLLEAGELVTQFQSLFFTALAARGAHRRRPADAEGGGGHQARRRPWRRWPTSTARPSRPTCSS